MMGLDTSSTSVVDALPNQVTEPAKESNSGALGRVSDPGGIMGREGEDGFQKDKRKHRAERIPGAALHLDAVHLTAGVAFLYVLGFVISNSHLGRFDLISPLPLQIRYVSAALLYIAFFTVPFALGFILSRGGFPELELDVSPITLPVVGWNLAVLLMSVVPPYLIFWSPGVAVVRFERISSLILAELSLGMLFFGIRLGRDTVSVSLTERDLNIQTASRYLLGGLFLVLFCFHATLFGRDVYPRISPAYGGGALWRATVLRWDSTTEEYDKTTEVILLDRSDERLSVVMCSGFQSDQTHTFVIPDPSRHGISLQYLTILPDSGEALCSDPLNVVTMRRNLRRSQSLRGADTSGNGGVERRNR
jgi:hypothetical protein